MDRTVIPVARARRVVALVGEAAEIGLGSEAARLHITTRALDLVGAACGATVLDSAHCLGGRNGIEAQTGANFTGEVMDLCQALQQHGCVDFNPVHRALVRDDPASHEPIVSATDTLLSRREWTESELFNDHMRRARVDRYLVSIRHVGQYAVEAFGLMRAAGESPFTEVDRHTLHLLHGGLGLLFRCPPDPVRLSPRVRQTRDVLLTGASDKEIAQRLGLGLHTVRQYVKTILEAYGVSSRARLIAIHSARGGSS